LSSRQEEKRLIDGRKRPESAAQSVALAMVRTRLSLSPAGSPAPLGPQLSLSGGLTERRPEANSKLPSIGRSPLPRMFFHVQNPFAATCSVAFLHTPAQMLSHHSAPRSSSEMAMFVPPRPQSVSVPIGRSNLTRILLVDVTVCDTSSHASSDAMCEDPEGSLSSASLRTLCISWEMRRR
jgi:hypothetical protein